MLSSFPRGKRRALVVAHELDLMAKAFEPAQDGGLIIVDSLGRDGG